MAEGVILGVLDSLNARLGLRHEDFVIGRNTGRDEFPAHVRTLGKFGKLDSFVVVLDGDAYGAEQKIKSAADEYGVSIHPLFLPGNGPPEQWIWQMLRKRADVYAALVGAPSPEEMERRMREITQTMEGMVQQGDRSKAELEAFASESNRTTPEIARIVGRQETEESGVELAEFLISLEDQIAAWRQL